MLPSGISDRKAACKDHSFWAIYTQRDGKASHIALLRTFDEYNLLTTWQWFGMWFGMQANMLELTTQYVRKFASGIAFLPTKQDTTATMQKDVHHLNSSR